MKPCSVCKVPKPLREFYTKGAKRRDAECKACRAVRTTIKIRASVYRLLQYYSKSDIPFCACCGDRNVEFLALHHINNDGSIHRQQLGGLRLRQYLLMTGERPKGLAVMCNNCNSSIGSYGYCPHKDDRQIFEKAYAAYVPGAAPRGWKLSAAKAAEVLSLLSLGHTLSAVAKNMGVSTATISLIKGGKRHYEAR